MWYVSVLTLYYFTLYVLVMLCTLIVTPCLPSFISFSCFLPLLPILSRYHWGCLSLFVSSKNNCCCCGMSFLCIVYNSIFSFSGWFCCALCWSWCLFFFSYGINNVLTLLHEFFKILLLFLYQCQQCCILACDLLDVLIVFFALLCCFSIHGCKIHIKILW